MDDKKVVSNEDYNNKCIGCSNTGKPNIITKDELEGPEAFQDIAFFQEMYTFLGSLQNIIGFNEVSSPGTFKILLEHLNKCWFGEEEAKNNRADSLITEALGDGQFILAFLILESTKTVQNSIMLLSDAWATLEDLRNKGIFEAKETYTWGKYTDTGLGYETAPIKLFDSITKFKNKFFKGYAGAQEMADELEKIIKKGQNFLTVETDDKVERFKKLLVQLVTRGVIAAIEGMANLLNSYEGYLEMIKEKSDISKSILAMQGELNNRLTQVAKEIKSTDPEVKEKE